MAKNAVTVGDELRRFRTRSGISQFDLAVCMAWKGTNPIIQIEKNRRIPRPDTIDRLGKCLGLSYLDIHYLNGLAGYHLPTRLPPPEFVTDTLDHIAAAIEDYAYPAYVIDYQFRIWLTNPATALFTLGDVDALRELVARPLHAFDITFDSRLGMRQRISGLEQFEQEQIFRFKASNAFRQHEPFFLAYPDSMDDLNADDYQSFRRVWQSIDMNMVTAIRPIEVQTFYSRLRQGDLTTRLPDGDVAFYLRVDSILHLGDLLQIVTFVPVDEAVAALVCPRYVPADAATFKVWALTDLDPFYA